MPISAAVRTKDLEQLAHEFNRHLLETPGNVLTGNLRCGVAQCARDALLDCAACQSFTSTPAGVKIFRALAQLKHEPEFTASADARVVEAIVNMVHALVNHSSRLDKDWYLSTIVALRDSRLIPSYLDNDDRARQFMVWSLYCEICQLAVISHAISMTFLVLDQEPPALPQTSQTVPKFIDFNLLKRSDRNVHQNDNNSFAPYLKPSDVEISTPEMKKLSDAAMNAFQHNMNVNSSKLAMIFAPEDLAFMDFMSNVYYVPQEDANKPYKALPSASRCCSAVSRHDVEIVALTIAEAYNNCEHLQSVHGPLVEGAHRRGDGPRTAALQRLAKAATKRDNNMQELEAARTTIVTDYGRELLVEMAAVIGYTEAVAKIAGPTGKEPVSKKLQTFLSCLFACCGVCR